MSKNETMIQNKSDVEKIPWGDFSINLNKVYDFWETDNRIDLLGNKVLNEMNHAKDIGLVASTILRLLVVTGDYTNDVKTWSEQLGEIWRGVSEGAVGQTLTWGDGNFDSTFAIIILSQNIALGLIAKNIEAQNFATTTFIHELAHIHDNFLYINIFGAEPIPIQGNWISLRQCISRSIWGEFFAESYTYPYLDENNFSESIAYSLTLLKETIQQINLEIISYQTHGKVGKVWSIAVEKISPLFNHIGRSLGLLLIKQQNDNGCQQIEHFLSEINKISPNWEIIVRRLLDIFLIIGLQIRIDTIDQIGDIVDEGFRSVGLNPYKE